MQHKSLAMSFKRLLLAPKIIGRYGKLYPDEVVLPHGGNRVHINPKDTRADKKLVMDTVRNRASTPMWFWRDHIEALAPEACLDIGANYGECFAFARYPKTRCLVVEANPTLIPHLTRTREMHPDAGNIAIGHFVAGDRAGREASFFFDPNWTGGGNAIGGGGGMREMKVPTGTIDGFLADNQVPETASLVIKMDVEGYEGKVLSGFKGLFGPRKVAGIMEFDTHMLSNAGTDPQELFETLGRHFSLFATFRHRKTLRPLETWAEVPTTKKGVHFDLAFFSDPSLIAPAWSAVA